MMYKRRNSKHKFEGLEDFDFLKNGVIFRSIIISLSREMQIKRPLGPVQFDFGGFLEPVELEEHRRNQMR